VSNQEIKHLCLYAGANRSFQKMITEEALHHDKNFNLLLKEKNK